MTVTSEHLALLAALLSVVLLILRGGRWTQTVESGAALGEALATWRHELQRDVDSLKRDAEHNEKWQAEVNRKLESLNGLAEWRKDVEDGHREMSKLAGKVQVLCLDAVKWDLKIAELDTRVHALEDDGD